MGSLWLEMMYPNEYKGLKLNGFGWVRFLLVSIVWA